MTGKLTGPCFEVFFSVVQNKWRDFEHRSSFDPVFSYVLRQRARPNGLQRHNSTSRCRDSLLACLCGCFSTSTTHQEEFQGGTAKVVYSQQRLFRPKDRAKRCITIHRLGVMIKDRSSLPPSGHSFTRRRTVDFCCHISGTPTMDEGKLRD